MDHFLCPGEVQEVFGDKPTKLDVRFAYEDIEDIFPQYYKLYGQSSGLKAYSDGISLWAKGQKQGEWIESESPIKTELEEQGFKPTGTLKFILPKVSLAGEYQIITHSFNSIVKLNSSINYIQHLFGRIQSLPLKLILEPSNAYINIGGKPAKKTVYSMRLHFEEKEIMNFIKKRKEALAQLSGVPLTIESPKHEVTFDEEDEEELDEVEAKVQRS